MSRLSSDFLHIPHLVSDLSTLLVPLLHIRQCYVGTIDFLLPLWFRRIESRLLFASSYQLRNATTAIIQWRFLASFSFLDVGAQCFGGDGIQLKSFGINSNAIIRLGASDRDKFALDFKGYSLSRTSERITQATAAPGLPLEEVALIWSASSTVTTRQPQKGRVKGMVRITYPGLTLI